MKNKFLLSFAIAMTLAFFTALYFATKSPLKPGEWKVEVVSNDTIVTGDKDRAIKDIIKEAAKQTEILQACQGILSNVHTDRAIPDTAKFNDAIFNYMKLVKPKNPK